VPRARTLVLLALLVLPGVAQATEAPGAPSAAEAWTARVLTTVSAHSAPSRASRTVALVRPVAPLGRGPTVLEVTDARHVGGREWVRLRLPVRPNGTQGWVPADALRFRRTELSIVIDQGERTLSLRDRGRVVMRVPVAVGKPGTPTPNGRFAVAELIRTGQPGAFLGPIVFPLTGYSRTLNEYAGGNGRVAIHGTSLPELLGTRASHGCIRVGNRWIVKLSRLVRPGTPVLIRP
jgi:lipoprotein-anchoring transpeptidase ErfK/SrfK